MISVIGWLNGLSLVFLLIFEVIYGLFLILKSIKTKAKLIRIAGLTCIFIGLAHTECSINFLYYLATGENLIEIKSLFFLFT